MAWSRVIRGSIGSSRNCRPAEQGNGWTGSASRSNLDLTVSFTHREARLRMRRRPIHHLPVIEAERRPMPRADDRSLLERAFGERAAEMGALMGERADPSVLSNEQQVKLALLRVDPLHRALGEGRTGKD